MSKGQRFARFEVDSLRLDVRALVGRDALHRELQTLIRRHLPEAAAAVLARPVLTPDGTTLEWFSNLPGQPVALRDVPASRRDLVRTRLRDHLDSLSRLAAAARQGSPDEHAIARQLSAATDYPDESFVYAIGDEPVVTFWGFVWNRDSGSLPMLVTSQPDPVDARPTGSSRHSRTLMRLLAIALGSALFLGSVWMWTTHREVGWLETELREVSRADCTEPNRLATLAIRLERFERTHHEAGEIRRRLDVEQERCARLDALRGQVKAAGWDCKHLMALQREPGLAPGEVRGESGPMGSTAFDNLASEVEERVWVCARAETMMADLQARIGQCGALETLSLAMAPVDPTQEPLIAIRERLAHELTLCAKAQDLVVALDAALADEEDPCAALRALERESIGLDTGRPPLGPVRERLDVELARCAQTQTMWQTLVDAQLDCTRIRALASDLEARVEEQESMRAIRHRLEDALDRCGRVDQLKLDLPE